LSVLSRLALALALALGMVGSTGKIMGSGAEKGGIDGRGQLKVESETLKVKT
jgi:hypothetical protein